MPRIIKHLVRFSALALSGLALFSATFTTQALAKVRSSLVFIPSDLAGVSWDADYTQCRLSGSVSGASLKAEISQHDRTLTTFLADSGSSITGSMDKLFMSCSQLKTADLANISVTDVTMNQVFMWCPALETLIMPQVINTSSPLEFAGFCVGCTSLSNVSFPGEINVPPESVLSMMFFDCKSLRTLDLSALKTNGSQTITYSALCANCDALEDLDLGDISPGPGNFNLCMFADTEDPFVVQDPAITGGIPNIKRITMSNECILFPGEGDYALSATGTFFDYKEPEAWSAYWHGEATGASGAIIDTKGASPDAVLVGFDEFWDYQKTHPGLTTYVLGGEPTPDSEPTPDDTPAVPDADGGVLPQTGDTLTSARFIAVAALSGAVLMGIAYRKRFS